MHRFTNDLEPLMPTHRSSSESQFFTDNVLSYGNNPSRLPISTHSFEKQLTKEIWVIVEEMVAKSETANVWSLNSTTGNGWFTASTDGFVYDVYLLSSIIKHKKTLYK
jgi:hypothetical protein